MGTITQQTPFGPAQTTAGSSWTVDTTDFMKKMGFMKPVAGAAPQSAAGAAPAAGAAAGMPAAGGPVPLTVAAPGAVPQPAQVQAPTRLYDMYSNLLQNPGSMSSNPMYQFAMDEAMRAGQRQLAGQRMGKSGNALAALADRAAGVAGQQFTNLAQVYNQGAGMEGARWGNEQNVNQGWNQLATGRYNAESAAANAAARTNQGQNQFQQTFDRSVYLGDRSNSLQDLGRQQGFADTQRLADAFDRLASQIGY